MEKRPPVCYNESVISGPFPAGKELTMPKKNNCKSKNGKRKDSQGRVLKTGEYEKPNGTYEYRFTDRNKKRISIYAKTLEELRRKEDDVAAMRRDGVEYGAGDITVIELIERYIALKRGVRNNTMNGYKFVLSFMKKQPFGQQKIRNLRISDGKLFIISLYDQGYAYGTIACVRGVLKPAFQMAYSEDVIRKNPFDFRLDVIPNNTQKRVALTPKQQKAFMDYIAQDEHYCRYLDEITVLLGTGMRVSEFCGLTMSDLDFENRKIRVDHQLVRTQKGQRYVEKTKTESGCRFIPMSDEVCRSLYNILANRKKPKKEIMIDGYAGFILLDKNGNPKVAMHIEHTVRRIWQRYNEDNIIPLPKITPHVFRHTFCTNMANAGMDLKSLQYLMGHADASVTMNVYTHNSYEKAEESMSQILPFTDIQPPERKRRTG